MPALRKFVAIPLALALLATGLQASREASRASASSSEPASGVLLDGWGGIHPFGGAQVNAAYAPYWRGWDIARALVVLPDGSGGWTLDGWGGISAFGSAPPIQTPAYWRGWDIARGLVVLPDRRSGYLLDGWGGVHPFGAAPFLPGYHYWPGWDIARGLDIHLNSLGVPDGGWTLDGWGGISRFGNAPALPMHFLPNWDVYWKLHVVGNGAGAYLQGRWGVMDSVGAAGAINFAGMPSWGTWDIVRDVVPLNPVGSSFAAPPVDRGAAAALMDSLQSANRVPQGLWALAEDWRLDGIEGNGIGYNTMYCGGPNYVIGDRTYDLYVRNYFAHAIPGCAGTQYIFSTYFVTTPVYYSWAGENIAWRTDGNSEIIAAWNINYQWLTSPEHLANILSGNYSRVGCGVMYAPGGSYQGAVGNIWIWGCAFTG